MTKKLTLDIPMNRVEGDLEVRVQMEEGAVVDASCTGVMYRGFERIMVGRGALDGLVLTPRICGICTTAHLTAAALALDMIVNAQVPPNAVIVRNLVQMTEHIQSDMRQAFLMFAADFANTRHAGQPLFEEAVRRYEPLKGEAVLEVVRETKRVLGIVSILGGQWPHLSYMVPGGIAGTPSLSDQQQCRYCLDAFRGWFEQQILGCSIERWREVRSAADLDRWLEEREEHQRGELGFFLRFGRALGLEAIGGGYGNFLSVGSLPLPAGTAVKPLGTARQLVASGFMRGGEVQLFDEAKIAEHLHHSWFEGEEPEQILHPAKGVTRPYATGREGQKYSWAKAPRYDGEPAETGPLAEALIAGDPLFRDLVQTRGPSALVRQLARIVRPAALLPAMATWLAEIRRGDPFYHSPGPITEGQGFGLCQATRGALGHWVKIEDARIVHYQIIAPTTWNASPRDAAGRRGPMEEALVGTRVEDPENPVELGYVVRSFDPCLVCTVHRLPPARGTADGGA